MLLEVKSMTVHYGGAEYLRDIAINVGAGEIITIIGSNGAGKTTLLRAISGLKKLTTGEIRFLDKRIDGVSAQSIVDLGIRHVPQGRLLFSHMSVMENIKLGAFLRRPSSRTGVEIDRIFKTFPILKSRRHQQAGTLSGGEQQMLAIARALVGRPKLLMLDEPSIGLAPLIVKEMANIIKEINREGTSILLVEQNARMALRLAHRGYVLETGRIALQGTGGDLLHDKRVMRAYLGQ